MAPTKPLKSFVSEMLHQYDTHLHLSGVYDEKASYSEPSLTNGVLPMFINRWVTGPGQQVSEIYEKVTPAFQLASRLLTETHPLKWFTHLTYGERRSDGAGVYIACKSYENSPEAITKVKNNIRDIGKVVSFMFEPPGYEKSEDGSCSRYKSARPFFKEFRSTDWPPIRPADDRGHTRPCIVITSNMQKFFRHHYKSASQDEIYRALLMFAVTLVHEFVHAYHYWLTPEDAEPRWCRKEIEAELGWSWERFIFGCGLQRFRRHGDPKTKIQQLYKLQALGYNSASERDDVFRKFVDSNFTDHVFTKCDATGRRARPALMNGKEFGLNVGTNYNATQFVAAIMPIPMSWVVAWFQEDQWICRKQFWSEKGQYVRCSLGKAFMILYERNGHKAGTLRPLNPAIRVDRKILERRARGKRDC